jgi:xylulokinase
MAKLLGIDIGTSGCKVILVNENGEILRQASAEYPLSVPKPMWSEQDPEDWWNGVQKCLSEIDEPNVDAIGITGQMHGSVFLDAHGEVIRPALLWNDQRTTAECEEIETKIGSERLKEITCNPALTGFQLPKILWLRNNEPEHYARLAKILLPKDFIRYKLTGGYATEVSDASGTGIFDVKKRDWSYEMMEILGLNRDLFPKVFESDAISTHFRNGREIPVVGDQAAAAVGTGAVEVGVISVSLGTSGVVFTSIPSSEYDPSGAAHTFCHANRGWHAMGVMLSCGGALRWYRDTFGAGRDYDQLAVDAVEAPLGSEGLTFLPYLTGERCPHNDPFARATFAGATLAHGRSHFDRAVFEGLTFGLFDGYQLLKKLGAQSNSVRVTSGGSKSDFWMQMIADVFGVSCQRLSIDEGPAMGAAILAGVGIGLWPDVQTACRKLIKISEEFTPSGADYSEAYVRFRELYQATLNWSQKSSN